MNKHILYLAAGSGSRFGSNKLLCPLEGKPLFRHGLDTLAGLVRARKDCDLTVVSRYGPVLEAAQIDNLRRRLNLTRAMQILGIASLFLCVVTMFLLYIGLQLVAAYVFGAGLLALIGSLGVSIREIQISVRALEIYLNDMEH